MTSGKDVPRTSLPYLFLGSVAALFLEMTLIRWVSTEIRVFAYVQNLALIACFLGFGLGCYHAGKRIRYQLGTACALAMIVLITFPLVPWRRFLGMISELLTLSPDSAMWAFVDPTGKSLGLYIALAVAVSTVFLLLLIGAMFPLGQFIGAALDAHDDAIVAYTVNLAGSLVGTWLLAGLSFLQTKPYVWFALSFLMVLALWQPRRAWIAVGGVLVLIIGFSVVRNDLSKSVVWSPYQKLQIFSLGGGDYALAVNNTGYMNLAHPAPGQDVSSSSYDSPFRFAAAKDRVLIVGAGAGTDAASALRNGARQVDAVEIDPAIAQFGRRYHADHPYASPAVHVIINDARNYMRTTDARYDVIIFGLLDSHTVVSAQTNMRVDNYVYTEESFREAVRLLKPDGILVLKFEVRPPWLWMGQRFDSMLTRIAGRPPIVYYVPDTGNFLRASVFMISKSPSLWQRAQQPELATFLAGHPPAFARDAATNVPGTSDDWPYVYHRSRTVPRTHLTITVILLALGALLFGREFQVRDGSIWEFFFLGAGFLCVETQMVSRCALYFGSTWLVNCFVISAALIVLVVANLLVLRMPVVKKAAFYAVLVASLVAIYFLPWASLPTSPLLTGLLLIFAYSIPLLCAGVIFADAFRSSQSKSAALGANLLGATFGGVAQNLSFIFGLKSLLLVSAVFYAAAWLSAKAGAARPVSASIAMPSAAGR